MKKKNLNNSINNDYFYLSTTIAFASELEPAAVNAERFGLLTLISTNSSDSISIYY